MAIYLGNTPIAENVTIQQGGGVEIDDTSTTATDKTWSAKKINESAGVGRAGTGENAEIFNDYAQNKANGNYSHAEGLYTKADGSASHSEGGYTDATGDYSHTEGYSTSASKRFSHAGGNTSSALKEGAFVHGNNVIADKNDYEIAFGTFNKSNEDTLFSVGNGTDEDTRSNAFEITKTTGKLFDKEIATKEDIPSSLPANGGNADTLDGKHASDFPIFHFYDANINADITYIEAKDGNTLFHLQIQTDVDIVRFFKSTDGGASWTELPLGAAASVGAYTEEKLAVLEARIAALEGGGT